MKLFVNRDTLRISEGSVSAPPVLALDVIRGDSIPVEIVFFRGTTAELLPDGTTLRLGIKEAGDFSGDFLASLTSFSRSESVYAGELNLNTVEAASAVGTASFSDAVLEVAWDLGGSQISARSVPTRLHNDVIKGSEGVPVDALPPYPPPGDIVTLDGLLAALAGLDLSGLPTSDPGGGKLWLNGGVLQVGAA